VCAPARYREQLAAELPTERLVSRENLSRLLPAPTRLIGPAFVGYAASVARVGRSAEELPNATAPAFDALRRAASTEEWEHAGLDEHAGPIFVELADGDVIAAAGYQRIAGELAHIGVLTHPDHRAAGRGRKVVAAAAERAISLGLMAQYQTLLANTSAIAIARSLGFERFATTIAAHLPVGADD
jgi:GNAT superfamily N-acetyltransferase